MMNSKFAGYSLALLAATYGSASLAECSADMPYQLYQDCLVYEGAGTVFPSSDYAYMALYLEWLESQKAEKLIAVKPPAE